MATLDAAAVDRYLDRLGLEPAAVRSAPADADLLTRLQTAHVRAVPFENLSIVGDPFADGYSPGVDLDVRSLHEKIVERERGGYCFELNGLFTALLEALGFDARRAASMMIPDDGELATPANHHSIVVTLDREYVVDVGMGAPRMRRPTPLDGGETAPDSAAVSWRVVPSERPQYGRRTEYRIAGGDWEQRYVFDPTPRDLSYFSAANDYLSAAPESWFTSDVVVQLDTETGWRELKRETFTRVNRGERTEQSVSPADWHDLLETEFDLSVPD